MQLTRVVTEFRQAGLRHVLRIAYRRVVPFRVAGFGSLRHHFIGKHGMEIGGPSWMFHRKGAFPVYGLAERIDNCNFSAETMWEGAIEQGRTFRFHRRKAPGLQYVGEASALAAIETGSLDFMLSSHALEHMANPIKALHEWMRVLKDDGILVLVLPHKEGTFDHRRPTTSLEHLRQDFADDVSEADTTHLDEIMALHDLARDPEAGDAATFAERSMRNVENRGLHHHVFDTASAVELVDFVGLSILAVQAFAPYHILVVAQKLDSGKTPSTERFSGATGRAGLASPFSADHAVGA